MNFTNYRRDDKPLRDVVIDRADKFNVKIRDWIGIESMLAPLGAKPRGGEFHRDHCYRVGLLASEIAQVTADVHAPQAVDIYGDKPHNLPKALFFSGLLHDVGKALVPACTLCATDRWTDEDRKNMEPHVIDGFRLLRDRFDFTAHVIARHHKTQTGGYPKEIPTHAWSAETEEKISRCAEILTMADVFDAMHRVNSATGGEALSSETIRERMTKAFGADKIDQLYACDVLR